MKFLIISICLGFTSIGLFIGLMFALKRSNNTCDCDKYDNNSKSNIRSNSKSSSNGNDAEETEIPAVNSSMPYNISSNNYTDDIIIPPELIKKKFENEIANILNSYGIYQNNDFYKMYELTDNYGDTIVIYSDRLDNCFVSCELNLNCYGFTRYRNYCYLKGKFDLIDITYSEERTMYLKQIKSNFSDYSILTSINY